MQPLSLRCLFVCLLAHVPGQAVLIDFTSRTDFKNNVTLNSSLPNENGVDFSTATLCPTQGCPTSTGFISFNSTTPTVTINFASLTGFNIQATYGATTGSASARAYLTGPSYVTPSLATVKYSLPVFNTRNLHENANPITTRINLPSNTNAFAIDLSNGCKMHTSSGNPVGNVGGNSVLCDPGDNHLGSIRITTSAGQSKVVNLSDPSNSVGEFRTVAARSDTDISWIELSLPTVDEFGASVTNIGAVVFTRVAFGQVTAVPEPSTWVTLAIGLALLLVSRRGHGL
jgi:hypothetical protein